MKIYATLARVEEMLEQTKGEIYIHHLWGHFFFLPGVHFYPMGRWSLPVADVKMLVLTIRRVTRLLWTLLLDFEQVRPLTLPSS